MYLTQGLHRPLQSIPAARPTDGAGKILKRELRDSFAAARG